MDPLERENSSDYVNQSPDQPEVPRPVQQAEPPKPKKSHASTVLAVLLLLALIAAGVLGWLWYQEGERASAAENELTATKKEVSDLKSDLKEAGDKEAGETSIDASSTESEKILAAALARAKLDYGGSGAEAQLGKQVGDYASVDVTTQSAGITLYLKKVDDLWLVISGNQGKPSQEDIDRYDIPQELLAE